MERQLTTVDIDGTLFYADAYIEALRQQEDRKKRIPFHVFDQDRDGYRFLFDRIEKTAARNKAAVLEDMDRYVWVIIPALMELDPEGIALRYDIPLEVLCPDGGKSIPRYIVAIIKPLRKKEKAQTIKSDHGNR